MRREAILASTLNTIPRDATHWSTRTTVKAIDTKSSAVTIETEDGRTMTHKVNDKSLVKNLNVGYRVVITYTTALAINIE